MLGYVTPDKGELKVKEYEAYRAYYCGICKGTGRRHGQLPRFVLSYDFVFLAMVLDSLEQGKACINMEHCIIHHIKRRPVAEETPAMAYAGDVMLILAYYKLLDDYRDDHSYKARAASLGLLPAFKQLEGKMPGLCRIVKERLEELSRLEKEKCPSLDEAAEPFAQIMAAIFEMGAEAVQRAEGQEKRLQGDKKILRHMGFHLGKWIYLMDAYEDIGENIEKGTYNPLLYRFGYEKQGSIPLFKEKIKPEITFNLMHYLAEVSNAAELLDKKKNKGIIDNIIYLGLRGRSDRLLAGGSQKEGEGKDREKE